MKTEKLFSDIVGQDRAKKAITDWYNYDTCPLLIFGPSGYGKTNFAEALGAKIVDTTQLRSDRVSSLLKPIKEAEDGDILFFDEIHSLQPKVLEGLYYIFDKGTFYDPEIGVDLPIPNVKFIFATNYLNKLPVAFQTRVKLVELQNYTEDELKQMISNKYPDLNKEGLDAIVKSCKGTPRTALRLAGDVISGLKTEEIKDASADDMNNILNSRFGIDPATGLSEAEFTIIQKVCDKGHLSTTAVANLLKISLKDAKDRYINPLQVADWLCVTSKGIVPGFKAYENYRLFVKKIK
jgi:Holliday junction resolvasome RuvABC ATP-dependent DNA helicase subunit